MSDHPPSSSATAPPALPGSPWIVRGETLDAQRDATRIRGQARQDAERLLVDASRAAQRLRDEAGRQGLEAGEAAAARLLADAADAATRFRQDAEAELVPLAFAIAHRILGSFPEEERLLRAVRTALDEHRNVSGLRLRASPTTATALRNALAAEGRADAVLIEIDDDVAPGGCTLVHPRGRAAIGPLDQLRSLFAAGGGTA
ncbi:type III secretion system stator protein SctL [Rhizosaccharibacter radicis]|uniref:Type 3 secretion system stator protein n=1 Tax=Rhizosaccharibacter radicis TaxID=2782605 RepID=A0ABT1VTE3_9PROT|nr:type III secretion system stator protein SctL [Acetobacteraceae bacterium KSS12]